MADFNRNNRGGGGRSFDRGRRDFGGGRGGDRGDREMHKAICSNCGRECEVPFRPTGAKPVYCSECFRSMGPQDNGRGDSRNDRRPSSGGGSAQPQIKEQLDSLNAKLDKILKILTPQVKEEVTEIKTSEPQEVELKLSEEVVTPVKKKRVTKKASSDDTAN